MKQEIMEMAARAARLAPALTVAAIDGTGGPPIIIGWPMYHAWTVVRIWSDRSDRWCDTPYKTTDFRDCDDLVRRFCEDYWRSSGIPEEEYEGLWERVEYEIFDPSDEQETPKVAPVH